jgi:dienelactone hydrolase
VPRVSLVRSLHTVASSGAGGLFDAVHVRVFYPAQIPGGPNGERPAELSSGVIAADTTEAPFPVVVICNPINIGPEYYRWLGLALAPLGYVVATVSWMSPGPGGMVVQAGGPLAAMGSENDQAPGIDVIVDAVAALHGGAGPLAGLIDRSRVGVIGHSAGGTMALGAADHRFHPNVAAVVAMGAHNAIGMPPGSGTGTTMRRTPTDCPVLLIRGTHDGVIDRSRFRYDTPEGAWWDPVSRTFHEAFTSGRGDCLLAVLAGATHFSFADPDDDPSAGRPFLDYEAETPGPIIRAHTASMIGAFLDTHLRSRADASDEFDALLASPLVATSARR